MPVTDPSALGGSDDYTLIVKYYDYDGTELATKTVLNKASSFASSNKYNNFSASDVATNYPNSTPTRLGYVFSGWGNIQTSEISTLKSLDPVSGTIMQDTYSFTKTVSATAQYTLITSASTYAVYTFIDNNGDRLLSPVQFYTFNLEIDVSDFLGLYPNVNLVQAPDILPTEYDNWNINLNASGSNYMKYNLTIQGYSLNAETKKVSLNFNLTKYESGGSGGGTQVPFFIRLLFPYPSSDSIIDRTANPRYNLEAKYLLPRESRLIKHSNFKGISANGNTDASLYTSDMCLNWDSGLKNIAPWVVTERLNYTENNATGQSQSLEMIVKGGFPKFSDGTGKPFSAVTQALYSTATPGYYYLDWTPTTLKIRYRRKQSEMWAEKISWEDWQFREGKIPKVLFAALQGPGGAGGLSTIQGVQGNVTNCDGGGGGGSGAFMIVAVPLPGNSGSINFTVGEGEYCKEINQSSGYRYEYRYGDPYWTAIRQDATASCGSHGEESAGGNGGTYQTDFSCPLIIGVNGSKGGDGNQSSSSLSYSRPGGRGHSFYLPLYYAFNSISNSTYCNFYSELSGRLLVGGLTPGNTATADDGLPGYEEPARTEGKYYHVWGAGSGGASSFKGSGVYGQGGFGGLLDSDDRQRNLDEMKGKPGYIAFYY